jgi:cytochrome c-type biogenesis protein CcmH
MTTRREFLARLAGGAAVAFGANVARAQGTQQSSADSMEMDASAVRPVRLPAKPNAMPLLTVDQRDELEHHLHCQCGTCTLDVYTCRTTDFSCPVSPAMHRDVMALVQGGYGAQEILDAFTSVYGERVLMAPRKSGFNLMAWLMPGAAVVVGAAAVGIFIRRLGLEAAAPIEARGPISHAPVDATADELAWIEAAVRGERDDK